MVRFTSSERFLSQWGVGTDLFIGAVRDGDQCIALIARDGLTDEQATSNAERIVATLSQAAGVAELPAPNKIAHDLLIDLRAAAAIGRPITGDEIHEIEQRMIAALALSRGVPDGWKLVPVEPTESMKHAGWTEYPNYWGNGQQTDGDDAAACYAAMLKAAPAAAGAQGEVQQMQAKAQQRVEPIGFRSRLKDGGKKWEYVDHRSPDSFELRECVIEPIYTTPQPAAADGGVRERARYTEQMVRDASGHAWEYMGDSEVVPLGLALELVQALTQQTALSSHRQAGNHLSKFRELAEEWKARAKEARQEAEEETSEVMYHANRHEAAAYSGCAYALLALVEKGAGNG